MKKLTLVALLLIATLLLVACNDNKDIPPSVSTTQYLDGIATSSPVEKGNYVVYVKPSDDSKWTSWDYDNWAVKDADQALSYSVYFFTVDTLFDSVEALKGATLSAGARVGTKSYHAGLGRGAAIYDILAEKTSGPSEKVGSVFAKVVPFEVNGDKIVTVDQFGTKADGKTSDNKKIDSAINYADANVVEFEGQVYLQKDTIKLDRDNVRINAKGAEINNEYKTTTNRDFQINEKGTNTSRLENITIENLKIVCTETTGKGALYNNADHYQFEARYTNNLVIRGCEFLVPEYTNVETDLHITSVSLRCGIDTLFENNKIVNFSFSDSYSGGLWFWSNYSDLNEVSTGLTVRNNYIEKCSHDEVLAFFNGAFDGILVENNTITTHDEPIGDASPHAIGFGVNNVISTVKNATFRNNTVDVVCEKDIMMFSQVENIEIYDNTFIARANSDSEPIQYAIFRVTFDESYAKEGIKVEPKNVKIYNNKITVYNSREIGLSYACENGFEFNNNPIEFHKQ